MPWTKTWKTKDFDDGVQLFSMQHKTNWEDAHAIFVQAVKAVKKDGSADAIKKFRNSAIFECDKDKKLIENLKRGGREIPVEPNADKTVAVCAIRNLIAAQLGIYFEFS